VGAGDRHGAVRDLLKLVDEPRPFVLQVLHHGAMCHDLVAHIDRRADFSIDFSTMSMARTTPAQKPRGWAKMPSSHLACCHAVRLATGPHHLSKSSADCASVFGPAWFLKPYTLYHVSD